MVANLLSRVYASVDVSLKGLPNYWIERFQESELDQTHTPNKAGELFDSFDVILSFHEYLRS